MPDANGNLLPGEPGYQPQAPTDPSKSVPGLLSAVPLNAPAPATPVTGYTPAQAAAKTAQSVGYDPNAFAVTDDQTVQGQLKKIVDADSPLLQQARVRANQEANNRGLLNSSMAVGAGQEAVIAQALPIAQQDAGVSERAATNTVNARNAAAAFEASAKNTAEQTNAQLDTNVNLNNAQAFNTALGKAADAALQLHIQQFDTKTKTDLATLDAQNRQLLQTNVNAANMFQEVVKNIAAIATNNTMSQQAKDDATASQINLLNEGLKATAAIASTEQAAVASLNLSQYFSPEGSTAGSVPGTGGLIQSTPPPPPPPPPTAPPPTPFGYDPALWGQGYYDETGAWHSYNY